jgi:RNA polymerase sigma-70 factor (ECF subfamily)
MNKRDGPFDAGKVHKFLENESASLLPTLRYYIHCARICPPRKVNEMAEEVLNDVVVVALTKADQFRSNGRPKAWILGIAANIIKRLQADQAKRRTREPLIQDLIPALAKGLSEGELFDQFIALSCPDPGKEMEAEQAIARLLAGVSEEDQRLLRMAVIYGLSGKELGEALGISAGAARVRLHRALNRVREIQSVERNREDHG